MEKYQQQFNHQDLIFGSSIKNERRKHPRYKMNKNVWSISEDILAEVVDISGSGMSFRYLTSVDVLHFKIYKIELVNLELGTSVKGLLCRLVRSNNKVFSLASPSTMIMNLSLEFQDLTQFKCKQLFQFIKKGRNNGIECKNLMQDTMWKGEPYGIYI